MKRDQYIPHDVTMRSSSEVIHLVEKEGAAGYGFFWALMEYLRMQNDYEGDLRAVRTIARQMKIRMDKALRILNEYALFTVSDFTFRSPKLDERMTEFDRRRAQCEAYKRRKTAANVSETPDKSLSINGDSEPISLIQPQKQPQKQPQPSSSVEKVVQVAAEVPVTTEWEKYVDALQQEEQWIEIMAMRGGLGKGFVQRFGEVLRHFKRHVLAVGSEERIRSLSDAKHYFNNFNTPGSPTFVRLSAELMKPVDRGKFRYEEVDAATGQRSYCGVVIPPDAPPRPNEQAVWCEGEWVY